MIKFKLCIYDNNEKILAEKLVLVRTKFNYIIVRGFRKLQETIDLTPYSGQLLLGQVKYYTPSDDVYFVNSYKIKISDDKQVSIKRMAEITPIE
jgi:hypothetical protein